MDFFQAALLGIVEGITEFLPISSTGHLIIANHLLGIPDSAFLKSFEIIIQLGAILAVVWLYLPKILGSKKLWLPIIYAFIPTGVLGFLAYPIIKKYLLDNLLVTTLALFFGGIVLFVLDRAFRSKTATHSVEKLPLPRLIAIGLSQSFAFIPGVSRSAASIIGGLAVGLTRAEAVEFSFLLAIPTMAAATGYDVLKTHLSFTGNQLGLLGIGFFFAFITAIFTVKAFISYISRKDFTPFAVYRIFIAIVLFFLFRLSL